jgi:hypothetical protein
LSAGDIAEAARRLEPELSEQLALRADAIADSLADGLNLVAWDRELVIGRVQSRVYALRRRRIRLEPGDPVTVLERREQPLESLLATWGWLRRGRAVRLAYEAGCSAPWLELMRRLGGRMRAGTLQVDTMPVPADPEELVGVHRPGPRMAIIDADADRELAAYVLARTALRRNGFDPRAVRHAYVGGNAELLRRHLGRLWVGVQIGRPDDPGSFAGPVTEAQRDAYLRAYEAWAGRDGVKTWAEGGALERTDDDHLYLAPAAFAVEGDLPDLPIAGPMLVLVLTDAAAADAALARTRAAGGDAIAIGGPARDDVVRHVRGALLVERLPPGLPEPRPV